LIFFENSVIITAKYISALMALGIIKKEKPLTEDESRKSIYLLNDQLFRFWYRFIPGNMSSIAAGLSDIVYDRAIAPQLSACMGQTFELICAQYLISENAKLSLPFVFGRIGRWWGNNPDKKRQEEIDILAVNEDSAIFGECKWRNEPTGMDVLKQLVEKSECFKRYKDKYHMLFSRTGFTAELEEAAARKGNTYLVDLRKLYHK
jgi:AAA+ ATPase superfamily predicted ATPase